MDELKKFAPKTLNVKIVWRMRRLWFSVARESFTDLGALGNVADRYRNLTEHLRRRRDAEVHKARSANLEP